MKKYSIHIEQTRHADIEVEANSYAEAEMIACNKTIENDDCWGCYENNCWENT